MLSLDCIKRFSLDYIKVRIPLDEDPEFDTLLNKISYYDDDNSNSGVAEFFDADFAVSRSGHFYMFSPYEPHISGNIPFAVLRIDRSGDAYATVDIYSAFFHWTRCYDFLEKLLQLPTRVMRVDIALDVSDYSVLSLASLADTKLPVTKINERIDSPETYYIGDWNSKRKLIRIYNKKLHAIKNRRTMLYPEYFADEHSVITRLEIELRNQACQSWMITLQKLLDPEFIYSVFYSELNTKFVSFPSLPISLDSWYSRPVFERGIPDPVLRFREALRIASKNGVDIDSEFRYYLGVPI